MHRIASVAVVLMCGLPAFGQGTGIPAEVKTQYEHLKANVLKAADKMPAEDYSYKPTPDVRSFARVVDHITEAQFAVCGGFNNSEAASKKAPPETADKATTVEALKASYAECDKAYAGLTEANMAEVVKAGPFTRSRIGLLWGNVSHDNEQYATLALYMRLKGLVPPSSEK